MDSSSSRVKRSLFIASLDSLDAPHHLGPAIIAAVTSTTEALTVVLLSPLFALPRPWASCDPPVTSISRTERWDAVQRLLTCVYVQATKVAQDNGRILMDIGVLLKESEMTLSAELAAEMDVCFLLDGDNDVLSLPHPIRTLPQMILRAGDRVDAPSPFHPCPEESLPPLYPVVALGGTFDHLHAGHKILLSMAAWITEKKLIVGLTDDALLKNKSHRHLLESLSTRMYKTRAFLNLFRSDIEYDLVAIADVCGPTGWDPNIQALVVSKETLAGAAAIAQHRASKALPALRTFVIDVISATSSKLDDEDAALLRQTKMGSTFIRQWLADREGMRP